jgi:predicted MFS family arabinose efflux permease
MHELTALGEKAHEGRVVLKQYSSKVLTVLMWATAIATTGAYALYTLDPSTRAMFHTSWLWLTTANTAFGVLRFLALVRRDAKSESPTEEMLKDPPFLANLLLWGGLVVVIIYFTGQGG